MNDLASSTTALALFKLAAWLAARPKIDEVITSLPTGRRAWHRSFVCSGDTYVAPGAVWFMAIS